MRGLSSRLDRLEAETTADLVTFVMDFGEDHISVDGELMTRAEFEERYPNHRAMVVKELDGVQLWEAI